ncbi:MAG: hypothetical protein LBU51_08715 [Bacteroidales bacterium]|jgi:hypothetical protein|nr:hypothetical protein [Bacteroidales bacterium]
MHHLFVKNEKLKFVEIENTKVAVQLITTNQINYYLENYVFDEVQNRSYISVGGNFEAEVWKNRDDYKRAPIDRFEIKKTTKNYYGAGAYSRDRCYSPCIGAVDLCSTLNGEPMGCTGGMDCSCRTAQSILAEKNRLENMLFDMDLMYAFRDDFLYSYEKGEEYVDHYYYLSEEYQKRMTLSLALKTALFFNNFNPIMEKFVDADNHLSDIMFNDDLANSLLALLDEYEEITNSTEGQAILASIRADINAFKNKPLQDILAMID